MATVIRLCAKNDINGNPRRAFVIFGCDGNIRQAVDEGYAGRGAIDGLVDSDAIIPDIETTPREYRDMLRRYGK